MTGIGGKQAHWTNWAGMLGMVDAYASAGAAMLHLGVGARARAEQSAYEGFACISRRPCQVREMHAQAGVVVARCRNRITGAKPTG